ncbi:MULTISPECIES: hypothetical protein [unclassified Mycolicibacterium]|uniref:hypothetical protein n=1 Tax=unclassified Mycolicibacterium TaxID=2636767 RepID=UPI002EDA4BF6
MPKQPTADDLIAIARTSIEDEFDRILSDLTNDDLTAWELAGVVAILRPALERREVRESRPAVSLQLVSSRRPDVGTRPSLLP